MTISMRKFVSVLLCFLIGCFLLCGCTSDEIEPINKGETYLDGSWYLSIDGLNVGYNLFENGGGYQFIGSTVNPIRYGIYQGSIYIQVTDGPINAFPFEQNGASILIDGMTYLPVKEDPAYEASIKELLTKEEASAAAAQEAQESDQPPRILFLLVAVILALVLFGFLFRWFGDSVFPHRR